MAFAVLLLEPFHGLCQSRSMCYGDDGVCLEITVAAVAVVALMAILWVDSDGR